MDSIIVRKALHSVRKDDGFFDRIIWERWLVSVRGLLRAAVRKRSNEGLCVYIHKMNIFVGVCACLVLGGAVVIRRLGVYMCGCSGVCVCF